MASGATFIIAIASFKFLMSIKKEKYEAEVGKLKRECEQKSKNIEANYHQKEKNLTERYNELRRQLSKEYEEKNKELVKAYYSLEKDLRIEEAELENSRVKLTELIKSTTPFSRSAALAADIQLIIFKDYRDYLLKKSHPALSAAETVSELKREVRRYIKDYKLMLYKYEYLKNLFPELGRYLDDDEGELVEIEEFQNNNGYTDGYDRVRDYISKEEYMKLSESERNQRAYDKWKAKNKSKWIVGMLYEIQVSQLLQRNGYKVEEYGMNNGFQDLGRDIIAHKEGITYIIQCKNWNAKSQIHENTVCQTFGTTIEYELSKDVSLIPDKIVPVIITTTTLSETALRFANKLGVEVKYIRFDDSIPLIKCNINNKNKIYHLPFDQQYWHTYIDKEGEFYAYTVEEAEKKGFRRAYRWSGS